MKCNKKNGERFLTLLLAVALLAANCLAWGTQSQAALKARRLTLDKSSCTMFVGEDMTIKVKSVQPAGASQKVTWYTSNKKIATVKATAKGGKVIAKKSGTVTITVKSKSNPGVKATCRIKVYKATKSIKVRSKNTYTLNVGQTKQLSVTTSPVGQPVTWSPKDKDVAKVDSKGKVTAISEGKTTITAKSGKKMTKVTVIVKKKDQNILASGKGEGMTWKLYKDGKLVISGNYKTKNIDPKYVNVRNIVDNKYPTGSVWPKYEKKIRSVVITAKGIPSMESFFSFMPNLESIDMSGMDASKVATMRQMIGVDCQKLRSVNMKGLNAGKVKDMWGMFLRCKNLENVNMEGMQTGSVTDMGHMFGECTSLKKLDLSGLDIRNVKNMYGMFQDSSLESLNLSGLQNSKAEDMMYMFHRCKKLKRLELPATFQGNIETNMTQMFQDCSSLEVLDLGGLHLGLKDDAVRTRGAYKCWMLNGCTKLRKLDLSQVVFKGDSHNFELDDRADCANLQSIMVPVNLRDDIYIDLGAKYQDASGNIYEYLPQNVTETFEIKRIKGQ